MTSRSLLNSKDNVVKSWNSREKSRVQMVSLLVRRNGEYATFSPLSSNLVDFILKGNFKISWESILLSQRVGSWIYSMDWRICHNSLRRLSAMSLISRACSRTNEELNGLINRTL